MEENRDITEELEKLLALNPDDEYEDTFAAIELTTDEVQEILAVMCYERQRTVNPAHVGMLADMMLHKEFLPLRLLTFCIDDVGQLALVDGQHRLEAALTSGWIGRWLVCCIRGDEFPADKAYTLLDTSQKERSAAVISKSIGYDQLYASLQTAVVPASRYQCQWSTEYENPLMCKIPPTRDCIDRGNSMIAAYEKLDKIIFHPDTRNLTKNRLTKALVVAVITETIHTTGAEAEKFWTLVATNGTGIAADLRNLLMSGRPQRNAGKNYTARLAAHAWNQRNSSGNLKRTNSKILRLARTKLIITG